MQTEASFQASNNPSMHEDDNNDGSSEEDDIDMNTQTINVQIKHNVIVKGYWRMRYLYQIIMSLTLVIQVM